MDEEIPTPYSEEVEAQGVLEAFVVENPELEELEALLSQFNLFEAIGAVRMEVRHSDFLAFLLDPSQKHSRRSFSETLASENSCRD